jgi:hypothetical protein
MRTAKGNGSSCGIGGLDRKGGRGRCNTLKRETVLSSWPGMCRKLQMKTNDTFLLLHVGKEHEDTGSEKTFRRQCYESIRCDEQACDGGNTGVDRAQHRALTPLRQLQRHAGG